MTRIIVWPVLLMLPLLIASCAMSQAAEPPAFIQDFLDNHCSSCHSADEQKGQFSIDPLIDGTDNHTLYHIMERAFKQVTKGAMPPAKRKQPSPAEKKQFLAALQSWLGRRIDDQGARYSGAFARRLNRFELENDLYDTLGIDRTLMGFEATAQNLPEEARIDGFDTIGNGLTFSSMLYENYQNLVDHKLHIAMDRYTQPQRWRLDFGSKHNSNSQAEMPGLGHKINVYKAKPPKKGPMSPNNFDMHAYDLTWQLRGQSAPTAKSSKAVLQAFSSFFNQGKKNNSGLLLYRGGSFPLLEQDHLTSGRRFGLRTSNGWPLTVSESGLYKIRVRCRVRFTKDAIKKPVHVRYFNRSNYFIRGFNRTENDMAITEHEERKGLCFEDALQPIELPADQWTTIEFDDFRSIEELYSATLAGFTFDLRFQGSSPYKGDPKSSPSHVNHMRKQKGIHVSAETMRQELEAYHPFVIDIDWLEIEGPYSPVADPKRRIPMQAAAGQSDEETVADFFSGFLPRLYRRAVTTEEIADYVTIFKKQRLAGQNFEQAIRTACCSAYLSSKHLFTSNQVHDRKPGTALPAEELATRLSLFLWRSTPDDGLREWALSGKLLQDEYLSKAVTRLLSHPYASEFSKSFTHQWLHLYNMSINIPDQDLYPRYTKQLEDSMLQESYRFFHELLRHNDSIRNFIDCDWVLVNPTLMGFYGIKPKGSAGKRPFSRWRKVPTSWIQTNRGVRGGLFGQASILKLTSNSMRTSIVSRGVFILENLLDDPPPPPPDNAGEIANQVAGLDEMSVRKQLEIHRQRPACASCHNKIDPLGFALENYGALGQWRTTEVGGMADIRQGKKRIKRKGHPVDTKAEVMGQAVSGPNDLKRVILKQEKVFARCLVGKLMTYGLGRRLRYQDQAVIDDIVSTTAANGYRLCDIIHAIVLSDSFRSY